MHRFLHILFIWLGMYGMVTGSNPISSLSPNIRSIELLRNNEWSDTPFINLLSNDNLSLHFDLLFEPISTLRYRITHCSPDGTPSPIPISQYVNGFNDNLISQYALSEGTSIPYVHYSITIPNRECQLKLAGNYLIEVYPEDNPEQILLKAYFGVVKKNTDIKAIVSNELLQERKKGKQQVNVEVKLSATLDVTDPANEFVVLVNQNFLPSPHNNDILLPTSIHNNTLFFYNHDKLLFPAGNEYRQFSFEDKSLMGENVQRVLRTSGFYFIDLFENKNRTLFPYQSEVDLNGRMILSPNQRTSAEYAWVNIHLGKSDSASSVLPRVNGAFAPSTPENELQLNLNKSTNLYTTSILLKQGTYSFAYTDPNSYYPSPQIEGWHYQTENRYTIRVFHRLRSDRFFSLIGLSTISSLP